MSLAALIGEPFQHAHKVHGGDIAQAQKVVTSSGRPLFIKASTGLPHGLLLAEAEGLRALSSGGCCVPQVVAVGDAGLVLEWIERGQASVSYWERLGVGLAQQHRLNRDACGFDPGDNFIGRTPQPNPDEADLVVFFRDHRIGHMQLMLRQRGQLDLSDDHCLDRLRDQLGRWLTVPDERPALLHGDLWAGNAMPGNGENAFIYDPAAHYGNREADLAMTQLFGGFPSTFYDAYAESFELHTGFQDRVPLYNLYHLLNHALLFGGGYLDQSMAIVRRFTP